MALYQKFLTKINLLAWSHPFCFTRYLNKRSSICFWCSSYQPLEYLLKKSAPRRDLQWTRLIVDKTDKTYYLKK